MGLVKFTFKMIDYLYYFNQNGYVNKYKDVEIIKDVQYSDKHEDCKLNIHSLKDENGQRRPLAIFIHGGGFVAGGKKYRKRYPNFLANLGFKVFNIDYPLCGKLTFHEQVPIIADMLNFIAANKDKYNIDIDNSLVCGDSAGGFMSTLVAVMVKNKDYCAKFNCEVSPEINIKNAVLLCGMYDLERAMGDMKPPKFAQRTMGKYITGLKLDFNEKKLDLSPYEYYNELIVLNHVDKNFPRSFVVHVENDIFCLNQGYYMEEKLKENNVPFENYIANRRSDIHDFVMCDWRKSTKEAQKLIVDYLNKEYPQLQGNNK